MPSEVREIKKELRFALLVAEKSYKCAEKGMSLEQTLQEITRLVCGEESVSPEMLSAFKKNGVTIIGSLTKS